MRPGIRSASLAQSSQAIFLLLLLLAVQIPSSMRSSVAQVVIESSLDVHIPELDALDVQRISSISAEPHQSSL